MNNFQDKILLTDFIKWLTTNVNLDTAKEVLSQSRNTDIDSLINAFLMSPYYHPRLVDAVSDIRLEPKTPHIPEPHM